jgi:hypothetical protein
VVLPAPLGPIRAVIEPCGTSNVQPFTATTPPKRLWTPRIDRAAFDCRGWGVRWGHGEKRKPLRVASNAATPLPHGARRGARMFTVIFATNAPSGKISA